MGPCPQCFSPRYQHLFHKIPQRKPCTNGCPSRAETSCFTGGQVFHFRTELKQAPALFHQFLPTSSLGAKETKEPTGALFYHTSVPVLCPLPSQKGPEFVLAPGDYESFADGRDGTLGPVLDPPHEDVSGVSVDGRECTGTRDVKGVATPRPNGLEGQGEVEDARAGARKLDHEVNRISGTDLVILS